MSRRPFLFLLLIAFIDGIGLALTFPLFSTLLFGEGRHFVPAETSQVLRGFYLGLSLSIASLTQMLVSPFIGKYSDKYGRRPAMLFCLFGGVIGYLIATWAIFLESLPLLFLSRICIGISMASYGVVNACIADISSFEEKGRRIAGIHSAFGTGFAIGPLIGGFLAGTRLFEAESFVRPFAAADLVLIFSFIVNALWLPETCVRNVQQERSSSRLFDLFAHAKSIPLLLLSTFLFAFGWSLYCDLIPVVWIKYFHMGTDRVSHLYALAGFCYVLTCTFLVGPILRRVDPLILSGRASCVLFLCLVSVLFVYYEAYYYFLIPLANCAAAFLFPVMAVCVSAMAPKDKQGEIMGFYASAESLGLGLSPAIGGLFLGIHTLAPTLIGALCLLTVAIILQQLRKKAKPGLALKA